MLAATARGVRGTCEMRDAGLPVPLTDESPTVHEVDLDEALGWNQLARSIMATTTLREAETYSREVCGYSEIDYERNNKATWLKNQVPVQLGPETVLSQLDQFEAEARNRGITHTTFRRITESCDVPKLFASTPTTNSGIQRPLVKSFAYSGGWILFDKVIKILIVALPLSVIISPQLPPSSAMGSYKGCHALPRRDHGAAQVSRNWCYVNYFMSH